MIHQVGSKNEWLLLSVTFTAKLDLVFVLTFEYTFSKSFNFKANRNSPPFERSACFCVTISESFKSFQYFNFETNFLENKNLFQKSRILLFSWNHWDWKHIISIQNYSVRNQCYDGSIIIEVIRPVLDFYFFLFYDKISQVQKGTKKH